MPERVKRREILVMGLETLLLVVGIGETKLEPLEQMTLVGKNMILNV